MKDGNRNDRIQNRNDRNRPPNFLHKIAKNLNLCRKLRVISGFGRFIADLVVSVSVLREILTFTLQTHFFICQAYSNLRPITNHKHFCGFVYVCNVTFAVRIVVIK